MQKKYLKLTEAVAKVANGDWDLLKEAGQLYPSKLPLYFNLPATKYSISPGDFPSWNPTVEQMESWPRVYSHGWRRLDAVHAVRLLSVHSVKVACFKAQDDSGRCLWLQGKDKAPLPVELKLTDVFVDRCELEAVLQEHYGLSPQATPHASPSGPWPWGTHETDMLRHLAAAAEKWWKNYDPSEPDTAPTNAGVVGWLKERGVSERIAQAMATILRADGLATGPRPQMVEPAETAR